MNILDALLATIGSEEPGIKGRTLLQKRMYFLAVLAGENYRFSPHYYGPYSSKVADDLGALCSAAFVAEQTKAYAGPFGEIFRHDYRLTDEGKELLDMRSAEVEDYTAAAKKVTSHPIAHDQRLLSIAAKVHFIVNEHGQAPVSEIRQWANDLGWDVQPDQIDRVVDYLDHLGLVEPETDISP